MCSGIEGSRWWGVGVLTFQLTIIQGHLNPVGMHSETDTGYFENRVENPTNVHI